MLCVKWFKVPKHIQVRRVLHARRWATKTPAFPENKAGAEMQLFLWDCPQLSYPINLQVIKFVATPWNTMELTWFSRGVQYWVLGTSNHSPWQATLRRGMTKLSTSKNQDGPASAALRLYPFESFWGRNLEHFRAVQTLHSMDWFKGKSTGNHGFYHQI